MWTSLTNRRMAPELAARIEASVRGRSSVAGRGVFAPRLVAVLRLGLLLLVAGLASSFVFFKHRDRDELEQTRRALLDTVRAQGSSLTAEDRGAITRVESWLTRSSGPYEGDLVSSELRAPSALGTLLANPVLYIRGPIEAFTSPAGIAKASATSAKDALLLCLLEPPAPRTEKVLLGKVRAAYSGGAPMELRTANVRRLHEAQAGLPLLLPPWEERVQSAQEPRELARLARELEKAPIENAKKAVRAGLLLFAMDEPDKGGGPTELDGERAHEVRIGLVDMAASRVLLRIRRPVDPGWISLASRAEYASGLDGCALALDVHASVAQPSPLPR